MSSASYETHQAITSIKIHDDHLIAGTLEGSLVNFQIIKQNAKLKLQKLKSAKHHDSCVNSIDLSPQLLVTASRSGDIHLHFREDLYTSSPVKLRVSEREVSIYNVKVNSMESKIIACCEDGSIIQWDTSSDEESLIYQSHSSSILTGQFSPISPFVFASGDSKGVMRIHDLRNDHHSLSAESSMSSDDVCSIRTLTFISRGNYILYATLNDTGEGDTIGLYDVRTKSPVDDTVSMSCGGLSFVSGIHDNEAFLSHTNGALSRSRLETGDMRIECAPVNLKLNTSSHDYATFIDLCNKSNLLAAGGWYSGGGRIIITDVNNIHST